MRYNTLGRTGLLVSELCLGTMTFGGAGELWGKIGKLGQGEAEALIRAAVDAGINFIDTADVYSEGQSEEITGQALKNLGIAREEVVIATKAFGRTGPGPNGNGASRGHLLDAVKASLRRLQLDHIDLYQIHGTDGTTPVEETHGGAGPDGPPGAGALRRRVELGGLAGGEGAGDRRAARAGADRHAAGLLHRGGRDLEREIVPMLASEGVGLMVWSPLAGGLLSGKYDGEGAAADGRRANFDFPPVDRGRLPGVLDALRGVAAARGVTVAQVALAWLLHQPAVTSVLIGANRADQLPGQHRRGGGEADRGGPGGDRHGERAAAGVSRLDDRAAGGVSAELTPETLCSAPLPARLAGGRRRRPPSAGPGRRRYRPACWRAWRGRAELLDGAQVAAGLEEVGGEGMAQRVRRRRRRQAELHAAPPPSPAAPAAD